MARHCCMHILVYFLVTIPYLEYDFKKCFSIRLKGLRNIAVWHLIFDRFRYSISFTRHKMASGSRQLIVGCWPILLTLLAYNLVLGNVYLTALTCINGKYVCANDSTPLNTFTTRSLSQCASACAGTKNPDACTGLNYYAATNTCSLLGNTQSPYVIQPGCKHFTVCRYNMLLVNFHF
jgi:PAN domain